MNWGECLLIIVTYCGSVFGGISYQNTNTKCRQESLACVHRGIAAQAFGGDSTQILDTCLETPGFPFPQKTAAHPSPTPSPVLQSK